MKLEKFEEQVFFTTVRISTSTNSTSGNSIGTGFLLNVPIKSKENRSLILLISNKHVLNDPSTKIELNFTKKKKDSNKPDLGEIFKLSGEKYESLYSEHPNKNIDLACINLSQIGSHNLYFQTINENLISTFDEESLLPGLEVWFVGYPHNRYDVKNNLPLLRKGFISSIPKLDYNLNKQFVIDAQVFPGSSGSPVFTALNGNYKLVGIVSQTMIKRGKLEVAPTSLSKLSIQQILGLGIVIKAICLDELIQVALKKVLNA